MTTFVQPEDYLSSVNPKQLKKIYKKMEAKKVMMKAKMSGQDKVKDAILYVAEAFEDLGLYDATDKALKLLDFKLHPDTEESVEFVNPDRGKIANVILWHLSLNNAMEEYIALRIAPLVRPVK